MVKLVLCKPDGVAVYLNSPVVPSKGEWIHVGGVEYEVLSVSYNMQIDDKLEINLSYVTLSVR